jgi:hypothetical protein
VHARTTALLAGLVILAAAPEARGQSLKLRTLKLPSQDLVGTWISYHGRAQSRGSGVREFDQRLAVVAKQELGAGRWGLWVELKTTDAVGGSRIERGFFAPASMRGQDLLPGGDGSQIPRDGGPATPGSRERGGGENPPPASVADADSFVLLRYQVLTPGGKLYEYPVGTTRYSRASGDVASFELFEYDPKITPIRSLVGPDTLLLGRRVVPCTVEQIVRHGSDRWPMGEEAEREYHLVLTQTYWKNAAVPLTGQARSVFQAEVKPVEPVPDASAAIADSGAATADAPLVEASAPADTLGAHAAPPPDSTIVAEPPAAAQDDSARGVLAWTELTLSDLGADARPEIDQEPELAPDFNEPDIDPTGFQR